jgi:hypothetical protein
MASIGTTTPLRYEVNYRNYFLVTQGRVKILLIPPKDTRYLYPINDYDILEFRTPVNPWKVQSEYQDDFDKIKTLEVELFQGMAMFIPAYWWYSIQFIVHETSVCSFKYRTHMNTISIAPQLFMNVLQNMNTKRDTLEKRAFIKHQFQETTLVGNHGGDDSIYSGTVASASASAASASAASASHGPDYTPSIEDQYLPKSLRGTSSNPYSIMNAMTDNVSSAIQPEISNVMATTSIPTELETSIITASSSMAAASEYNTTQKEVTITPEIGTKNTE